jgi:hypothetical protein
MAPARFSIGIEMRPNALIFLALILQDARRRSQNSWESRRACKTESATFRTRSKPIFPPECGLHLRCRCLHVLSPPAGSRNHGAGYVARRLFFDGLQPGRAAISGAFLISTMQPFSAMDRRQNLHLMLGSGACVNDQVSSRPWRRLRLQ